MSLDDCLEYVADDELVEVRPGWAWATRPGCPPGCTARTPWPCAGDALAHPDAQEPRHEGQQEGLRLRLCQRRGEPPAWHGLKVSRQGPALQHSCTPFFAAAASWASFADGRCPRALGVA